MKKSKCRGVYCQKCRAGGGLKTQLGGMAGLLSQVAVVAASDH